MKFKESKTVELKVEYNKSILKTISAFANYDGGKIVIGVDDNGKIIGVNNALEMKLLIENTINDSIKPRPLYTMTIISEEDTEVIELDVKKGDDGPYFYQSIAYMRNDTSTVPIDNANLTRLIIKNKNLSFDQLKSENQTLIFNYLEKKLKNTLGLEKLDKSSLISLGLFQDNLYNNASELLSDNGTIVQSSLDIAKFKLDTDTFVDRLYLKGKSVLEYFDETLIFFDKFYSKQELVGGTTRKIVEPIPFVAFKEALANALVHRDYIIKNGIQIAMFDNRIEIRSPGTLPEGLNKDMYFAGMTSMPRNPILSYVFFRLGIIEQFGTGIRRILNSYSNYSVKPHFEINKYQIKIVLPVVNYDYTKLKVEDGIIEFLRANPESNRQSIENALLIEKSKILRHLSELESKNTIVKLGSGVSTKYKLNF